MDNDGQPNQLPDPNDQNAIYQDAAGVALDNIIENGPYWPGIITSNDIDLPSGLRAHHRLVLWDVATCNMASQGVFSIAGGLILDLFDSTLLPTALTQLQRGSGFGLTADTLPQTSFLLQFIYWTENPAVPDESSTPGTSHGDGTPDSSPDRNRDELLADIHIKNSSMNSTRKIAPAKHMDFRTRTVNSTRKFLDNNDAKNNKLDVSSATCVPWQTSLMTGNGGINVLTTDSQLIDANGRYVLIMQEDCNLVLYDQLGSTRPALWASLTYHQGTKIGRAHV